MAGGPSCRPGGWHWKRLVASHNPDADRAIDDRRRIACTLDDRGRHDAMTTATQRPESEARPRATYQDVLDAPPHRVAEVIDGVLYTNPRPAMPHALASSALEIDLGAAFQFGRGGPGGWWIVVEPELHLGDDILVPDLAGWRRTRMPSYPETAYSTLAPDWVCEILSPSTRRLDLEAKRPVYAREGVRHLWLVDPRRTHPRSVRAPPQGEWSRIATCC